MRQHAGRLALYPEAAAHLPARRRAAPTRPGERLVQPGYAASLRRLRDGGPRAFYEGPIAEAIARDMAASGTYPGDRGTMTAADLAAYRAIWREPVRTTYRGHSVVAMPPPTSGGLALVQTLNLLEGFDLTARAGRRHPSPGRGPEAGLGRPQRLRGRPGVRGRPARHPRLQGLRPAPPRRDLARPRAHVRSRAGRVGGRAARATIRAGHTTHVSVVDRHGSAVAVTCTIEQIFGSAVVAPGTGFLLNNQLTDFGAPGTANAPAPGKRPRSSTSPTIVARNGRPVLVVGGSGGPAIIGGVVNTVLGVVDHGRDVARAVDAERTDARGACAGDGLQLCLEDARVPAPVRDELARRGHRLQGAGLYAPRPRIQAVGVDLATGEARATSDPRNELATGAEAGRGGLAEPGVAARTGPVRVRVLQARRLSPRRIRIRVRVTARRGAAAEPVFGAIVRVGRARARTGCRRDRRADGPRPATVPRTSRGPRPAPGHAPRGPVAPHEGVASTERLPGAFATRAKGFEPLTFGFVAGSSLREVSWPDTSRWALGLAPESRAGPPAAALSLRSPDHGARGPCGLPDTAASPAAFAAPAATSPRRPAAAIQARTATSRTHHGATTRRAM